MSEPFDFEKLAKFSLDDIGKFAETELAATKPDSYELVTDLKKFWDKRRAAGDQPYQVMQEAVVVFGSFVGSCLAWKSLEGSIAAMHEVAVLFQEYILRAGEVHHKFGYDKE